MQAFKLSASEEEGKFVLSKRIQEMGIEHSRSLRNVRENDGREAENVELFAVRRKRERAGGSGIREEGRG